MEIKDIDTEIQEMERRKEERKAILDSFRKRIQRVWVSPFYHLGLLLVALAMVLLPILYVLLICCAGYAVYWHASHNYGMIYAVHNVRLQVFLGLLYLSPIIAGIILILFMLKPFSARRISRYGTISLNRKQDPFLFDFVDKVCWAIRAPRPREIRVDCEVNASASFRYGFWGLLTGKLVLTLGLPLVPGLSLSQLSGVLAHEFGHFSQRIGMRFTYIIISINHWLARVVYERDAWDEYLKRQATDENSRYGYMFQLARLMVWLTRKILWGLMHIGRLISCYMMRQMEHNADRYETRMVGSEGFETTARRLILLSMANQLALGDLEESWRENRLCDDFATLVARKAADAPPETLAQIDEIVQKGRTRWFDTHPSDAARIRRAKRAKDPGIIDLDQPALILFRNYAQIARDASLVFYHGMIGPAVSEAGLVSTESIREQRKGVAEEYAAWERYLQGTWISALYPFTLEDIRLQPPPDYKAVAQSVVEARKRIQMALPATRQAFVDYEKAYDDIAKANIALGFLRIGMGLPKGAFGLPAVTKEAVKAFYSEANHIKETYEKQLEILVHFPRIRLQSALQLLFNEKLKAHMGANHTSPQDVQKLLDLVAKMRFGFSFVEKLRSEYANLGVLIPVLQKNPDDQDLQYKAGELLRSCGKSLDSLRSVFSQEPYPLNHNVESITIGSYLMGGEVTLTGGDVFMTSRQAVDNFFTLYYRILGRLAQVAEQVELAIGLSPLGASGPVTGQTASPAEITAA